MSVARPTVPDVSAPEDQTTTAPASVLQRLLAVGIAEDRAKIWVTGGGVRVDDETVLDPTVQAPGPAKITRHY
jgi:hypothetical protein